MTEAEALALCAELAREHPERDGNRWVAREQEDGWHVVKVPLPEGMKLRPLTPTIEARPKPPQAEDPRDAAHRNAPGAWG